MIDLRRRRVLTVRLNDVEYDVICTLASRMGVSKSEVIRRMMMTVMLLFNPRLRIMDIVKEDLGGDELKRMTLSDALISFPEIIARLIAASASDLERPALSEEDGPEQHAVSG